MNNKEIHSKGKILKYFYTNTFPPNSFSIKISPKYSDTVLHDQHPLGSRHHKEVSSKGNSEELRNEKYSSKRPVTVPDVPLVALVRTVVTGTSSQSLLSPKC